jgi:hypothetical protein
MKQFLFGASAVIILLYLGKKLGQPNPQSPASRYATDRAQ